MDCAPRRMDDDEGPEKGVADHKPRFSGIPCAPLQQPDAKRGDW